MEKITGTIFGFCCYDCGHFALTDQGHYRDYCRKEDMFLSEIGNNVQARIDVVNYPNYVIYRTCSHFSLNVKEKEILKNLFFSEVDDGKSSDPHRDDVSGFGGV